MDFQRLITESNLDMLIIHLADSVAHFNLDLDIIESNSCRIVPKFLDEMKRRQSAKSYTLSSFFASQEAVSVQEPNTPPKKVVPAKPSKKKSKKKRRSFELLPPAPLLPGPSYCTFCKNNGVEPSVYNSHVIKDPVTKKVVCPTLRNYTCPYCQNKDKDYAHTKSHCPKWAADKEAASRAKSI